MNQTICLTDTEAKILLFWIDICWYDSGFEDDLELLLGLQAEIAWMQKTDHSEEISKALEFLDLDLADDIFYLMKQLGKIKELPLDLSEPCYPSVSPVNEEEAVVMAAGITQARYTAMRKRDYDTLYGVETYSAYAIESWEFGRKNLSISFLGLDATLLLASLDDEFVPISRFNYSE